MKEKIIILICILSVMSIFACDTASDSTDGSTSEANGSGDTSTIESESYTESVAESSSTYDSEDIVSNNTFSYTVAIDFDAGTAGFESGTAESISTTGITLTTDEDEYIVVKKTDEGITIESESSKLIKYELEGTLSGALTVESDADYQLYLDGVTINGSDGPALNLQSKQKVFIVSASGSDNSLSDDETRSDDMDMKASLYSKGPVVFSGEGSLTVNADYKHGVYSKDYIRVNSGALNINVSARDALRTVNGFIFDDGDLTINATGSVSDDESKGIKVKGSEDSPGEGYIVINGGTLDITSVSKAITASWDVDDDADTVETSDDPDPYVEINNGVLDITTTGTPYEYATGESCSPEGIEGKSSVIINGGYITVSVADDCVNAGESIEINGGYLYAKSTENDAIDSNGTLTITGGVISAIGSEVPESAFDCDNNTFSVTGGVFVGIGGATSSPTASSCTQNVVVLGSGSAGNTLCLIDGDGTVAFSYIIPNDYETMVLSSPDIETGSTYEIFEGSYLSYDEEFYGLCLDSLSSSGGSSDTQFTVSSSVTTVK